MKNSCNSRILTGQKSIKGKDKILQNAVRYCKNIISLFDNVVFFLNRIDEDMLRPINELITEMS